MPRALFADVEGALCPDWLDVADYGALLERLQRLALRDYAMQLVTMRLLAWP